MNPIPASPSVQVSAPRRCRALGTAATAALTGPGLAFCLLLLAGCTAPIGADRVTTREVYEQVEANALRTGTPSANTVAILHRQDLDGLAAQPPPGAFDRRFRVACDLYNYGLGQALIGRQGTNSVVQLASGRRQLPVGEIELRVDHFLIPPKQDK